MVSISIARQFTTTPGARYRKDGEYSGEEFRERFLVPQFSTESKDKVEVDLDNVEGYSTAFLEEAFGGLARIFGAGVVLDRIVFVSREDPLLVEEITKYIQTANAK